MALSPNNTLQQNLFETIKSNMETKDFTIDDEDLGGWLVNTFKKNGLLLRTLSSRVIQMSPPLCVTETEIDFIIDALDATLTKLSSHTSKV